MSNRKSARRNQCRRFERARPRSLRGTFHMTADAARRTHRSVRRAVRVALRIAVQQWAVAS